MRTRAFINSWQTMGLAALVTAISALGGNTTSAAEGDSLQASQETRPSLLTTAEQIHQLPRAEAARGHRAVIRGVVTCILPDSAAMVVQDSTRGLYVDWIIPELGEPPPAGELLEVEGITDPGEFAPQLHALKVTRLGPGELPQPVHPTWDQLI